MITFSGPAPGRSSSPRPFPLPPPGPGRPTPPVPPFFLRPARSNRSNRGVSPRIKLNFSGKLPVRHIYPSNNLTVLTTLSHYSLHTILKFLYGTMLYQLLFNTHYFLIYTSYIFIFLYVYIILYVYLYIFLRFSYGQLDG
jgi:hypothetical protein